jgi:hypothetical protein
MQWIPGERMSDIKLFRLDNGEASELSGSALAIEKTLQALIERNLEAMLGVRFIASEHSTGKVHGGRIDTLGLDENGSPVIVEYKRASNANVINQGLFYLDWLLDHKGEFTLLAMKTLGAEAEEKVDWSAPRLVCVAGDFTRYDEHAVSQIGRNIEPVSVLPGKGSSFWNSSTGRGPSRKHSTAMSARSRRRRP